MPENKFTEQERTLIAAKNILKEKNCCIIIRPTGFGKTWILTELIKEYTSVLYLYPQHVIGDTVIDHYYDDINTEEELDPETIDTLKAVKYIKNCTLMTYQKLIRLSDDEIKNLVKGKTLIITDEAHRLGAPKTKQAMEKIFAMADINTHFIGATATPVRMDNFDVISHFFKNNMTYVYTLYDAIRDNIIKKPYYCYATYDFEKDLKNAATESGQDVNDEFVKSVITAKAIELSKIYNMPDIIRDTCDKYATNTDYMKFIVFFASKNHMTTKLNEVINWFKTAYPDHNIDVLKISSISKEEARNTDKLNMLVPKPKHIDLIACIDMLNLGYHMNHQTGIFMYRGTLSNTIFTQQLGRALSAGTDNSAIVFDIVDNLHRRAAYELYAKDYNAESKTEKAKTTPKLDNYIILDNDPNVKYQDENGELINTQYYLAKDNTIVDRLGRPSTFIYDVDQNRIINTAKTNTPDRNINIITKACLHATGHEATYREIIAKTMAEPTVHRCKYTLQIHFRSWCMTHNIPYPISDEKLSEIYNLDIQDFYQEFENIIKENNIAYPLTNKDALLKIGKDGSTDASLEICCEATGTSIQQLTDIIFQE